jgi:formiminotetrahydrofolate cyclodeaminase
MDLTRKGRFVDEPLPNFCEWIAHPHAPSPAGGTVVASCAALTAALTQLIITVTRNRFVKKGQPVDQFDAWLVEATELRHRLLDYGEGDVYEAQKIIQGERNACVRKDVGSPAKIAGTIVKLLRLTDELVQLVPVHLHSDLRVVAYVAHGSVMGITEIALANIHAAGGADALLLERIERWRQDATNYRDRIVSRS